MPILQQKGEFSTISAGKYNLDVCDVKHESDVSEQLVETKFGVCDPRRFVNATYVVTKKA